ncbi:MAG: PTH1 family peptidyl-tRNA hydrolase [Glaciecola sp.]|jgi:PTH1 family peptidyl-tRNA hydrolase
MKYLIVGLGNIGSEYEETRHNIGFKVLDAFAKASNIFFAPNRLGDVVITKQRGRTLVLLKPSTFMNLSGKAVQYWMQAEKIPLENVLIITDDLALPFGKIRIRAKGSDGGHNGIKSIIETLGNQSFPRLRFGISDEFVKGKQISYVLGEWSKEELITLDERISICCDAIKNFTFNPIGRVMNVFNSK